MPKSSQEKLLYVEKTLKKLHYPHLDFNAENCQLNTMITGLETRILVLEFLLYKYNQTLFKLLCDENDYTDIQKRVYCIKCLVLQTGLWGQSQFGRNLDLNKVIEGKTSYETSLNFLYKVTKHVYLTLYPKEIYFNISTGQEMRQIQIEQQKLFQECLKNPHKLINPDVNPFPISFPESLEFRDIENIEDLKNEALEDNQFIIEQTHKLGHKLQDWKNQDLDYLKNNSINELDKEKFKLQLNMLKNNFDMLKNKKKYLESLRKYNDIQQENKLGIKFPEGFNKLLQQVQEYERQNSELNLVESLQIINEIFQ